MRLACIVLAHALPKQLASLLAALRHPQVRLYLHIDLRKPMAPFANVLAEAGVDAVSLLPRRETRWGGPELVDVSLDALSRAVADGCQYFVLLSGQDFPLRPIEEILEYVEAAADRSYVESFALPTSRWRFGGRDRTDFYSYDLLGRRETCIPRGEDTSFFNWKGRVLNEALRLRTAFKPPRRFPPYVRPFGGSQWWNLSRAAAQYVLCFLEEHPDYRAYHDYTLAPDELFFQSVLVGTGFSDGYEVVNDSLRFMAWPDRASHPRTLTSRDLPAMLASRKLFARKFDTGVDGAALELLAKKIAP